MAELTVLARLLRPQGRRGELLAELTTDFPERFNGREGLSLRRASGGSLEPITVEAHWLPTGRNAGRVVLKLGGVDSIGTAETLAGAEVVVSTEARVALNAADQEQYVAELLDCVLYDGDRSVGTVEDVQFPTTAGGARMAEAAPLLIVVDAGGGEVLVPFVKAWLVTMDVAAKRITMRLPEGLLEINR